VDTPGEAQGVAVSGTHAYVADASSGLQVIDITDPQSPKGVGSVDTAGEAQDVAVSGIHAYVADMQSGLQVIDITDPQSPQVVGSVDTPDWASDVALSGTHAYVADTSAGLQVIDVTDPQSPRTTGMVNTRSGSYFAGANGLAVSGANVYIANYNGLLIFPSQCPGTTAVELSVFEATPLPRSILITWSTAFELDHLGFNVHRSTRAEGDYLRVNAERIEPPGPYCFLDADVQPGMTYYYRLEAEDRAGGAQFFGPLAARTEGTPSVGLRNRLWPSHPNPFRAGDESAEILFTLAQRTRAILRVFDATGRQVRLLRDSVLEAGEHTAAWDGRNDQGEAVASGVYLYRLEASDFSETRPLVRLK